MVTVPIGLVIAGLNVGALAHQLGSLFPAKWVPDINHWQDFETLISELNQFREHINLQLELIGAYVDTWGHHLQHQYGLDKAALGNTLYQVQTYVDNWVASIEVTPPAPPVGTPSDFETKVWEAITELKATTRRQASVQPPPTVKPMPDPCIDSLTNQVATLQGEIEYLRQRLSNSEGLSSESEDEEEGEVVNTPAHDNHGCCPGLEGQPQVYCARALDQLACQGSSLGQLARCFWG
ncbi:hypothetical protein DSO57_1012085 [Entomophthora muscae]|uniref:Uncharacterized protein n=1 Tax=Entomophthora muscae TaxID=34485 RepID=A0ACC2TT28_9FUNG|nr:hypothetical protein DSO57_1012085 [Entomophthora muscae]